MTTAEQLPGIDAKKAALALRIAQCEQRIRDLDAQVARLQLQRENKASYLRRLGNELSEISTFELNIQP